MAIGFGAGSDMMGSFESNRKQVKGHRSLKENSEIYKLKDGKQGLKFKESSPEALEAYKQKLQAQKAKENKRVAIILVVSAAALLYGAYLLWF